MRNGQGYLLLDVTNPTAALAPDGQILAGAWAWEVAELPGSQDPPVAIETSGEEGDIEGSLIGETPIALPEPGLQSAGTPSYVTALRGARPNPFAGSAAIELSLAREGFVDLGVYDVRGARVRTLASGQFPAGPHTVIWDGRNDAGLAAPQGVYFIRMATGSRSFVKKALLMP